MSTELEAKRAYWREKSRQWRTKHGQTDEFKAKKKDSNLRCNKRVVAYGRKYRTGVEPEAFEAKLIEQNGRCAICHTEFTADCKPRADHDHVSGKFRGVLCDHCNIGVGLFKDSPERLASAIRYLSGVE
jgi:hypothetical protein